MKLLVEFESKEEMDTFFAASQAGAITPVASVYIVSKMPQSIQVRMTTLPDEPDAAVVELHGRGTLDGDEAQTLIPDSALKIL